MINVGKLGKTGVAREYEKCMKEKWEEVRGTVVDDVEKEWEKMKVAMKEIIQELCGMKRVGRGRRGTGWWNDDLENMCKEKRKKSENWLESKTVESRREYVACRNELREKVKECKRVCDVKWGQKVSESFSENKKLF